MEYLSTDHWGASAQRDSESLNKVKGKVQSTCLAQLKHKNMPNIVERIRNKTRRWWGKPYCLSGLPGVQTPRIHRRIKLLASGVAPRVQAAVFKTLWNGWVTERRFQRRDGQQNHCKFKCNRHAEDSIEHYCRCPVVMEVLQKMLHLHYPKEEALNVWLLNTAWVENHSVGACVALLVYGTYSAYNSIRHKGISNTAQARDCIQQHIKQGVLGHHASTKVLNNCWNRPLCSLC